MAQAVGHRKFIITDTTYNNVGSTESVGVNLIKDVQDTEGEKNETLSRVIKGGLN